MSRFGRWPKRFWRPLIGVVVAYAVAAQSLLIALGGFALAAHQNEGPGFELCLHSAASTPALPADPANQAPCSHCVFCFAGGHHAVIGSPPALLRSAYFAIVAAPPAANSYYLPHAAEHSIASPRGPPPRV